MRGRWPNVRRVLFRVLSNLTLASTNALQFSVIEETTFRRESILYLCLEAIEALIDMCQYVSYKYVVSRKLYTTVEAAMRANVPRATLQYWIATGKVSAPKVRLREGKAVRLWTEREIEGARNLKGTLKPGFPARKRKK